MATGHQQMSTGLVQYLLNTGSFTALFSNVSPISELRIYAGTVPATADAAVSPATVAAVVTGPSAISLVFGAAVAGVIAKSAAVWADLTGTNAGGNPITFYRLVLHGDADGASTTAQRVQGTIGTGGADMNVGSTNLAANANFTVNTFTQTLAPNVAA